MDYPLNQSSWRRGWLEARQWLFGSIVAWIIITVVFAVMSAVFTPSGDGFWLIVLAGIVGALVALVLIIGLTYLVFLIRAPYKQRNEARKVLANIPSKRKKIADRLAEFFITGNELRLKITDDAFNGDAILLVREWAKPLMDYFRSEPEILGESALIALAPRLTDWGIVSAFGLPSKESDYAVRHLSVQLEKLVDMIMELRK